MSKASAILTFCVSLLSGCGAARDEAPTRPTSSVDSPSIAPSGATAESGPTTPARAPASFTDATSAATSRPDNSVGRDHPTATQDEPAADVPASSRRSTIPIARRTTWIEAPVTEDGYIDYVAAMNAVASKGVTPDKNAATVFWQTVGSARIAPERRERFFAMLGVAPVPEVGRLRPYVLKKRPPAAPPLDPNNVPLVPDEYLAPYDYVWNTDDDPSFSGWLEANTKVLDDFVDAMNRPQWYSPMLSLRRIDGREVALKIHVGELQLSRELVKALLARATLRARSGRFEDSRRDIVAVHRLGSHLAREGVVISYNVGIHLDAMASVTGAVLASQPKLPREMAMRCAKDIDSLPTPPEVAQSIDGFQRLILLDCAAVACRNGLHAIRNTSGERVFGEASGAPAARRLSAGVAWDAVCESINEQVDEYIAILNMPGDEARFAALLSHRESLRSVAGQALRFIAEPADEQPGEVARLVATTLVATCFPDASPFARPAARFETRRWLTSLAFRLAAHRSIHGEFPAALDALVPDLIDELPADPAGGGSFVYRREEGGYVLYSIGNNRRDDGGVMAYEDPECDDIRVHMSK